VGACRQLSFSSSDNDLPAKEHSCDENPDTSKSRTKEKKLDDLKKNNNMKRPRKIIVSPVKRILVKRTPKTVGQTKIKSCVDKQVSKFCSPVLSFLASLSGIYTACALLQVLLVPKPLHAPSCNHSNVADDTYKGLRLALS
jgi:hypothetical protein